MPPSSMLNACGGEALCCLSVSICWRCATSVGAEVARSPWYGSLTPPLQTCTLYNSLHIVMAGARHAMGRLEQSHGAGQGEGSQKPKHLSLINFLELQHPEIAKHAKRTHWHLAIRVASRAPKSRKALLCLRSPAPALAGRALVKEP